MDALKSYKHVKRVEPQKESMLIEARTKQSPYSFGENIKLLFSEMAPQKVTIHISSYPVGRYILLDFGKNYKNVEYIGESINERLSEKKL